MAEETRIDKYLWSIRVFKTRSDATDACKGGKVRIKIEPGTQPGKALRLRGKGLPAVQGYGRGMGDMVVNISIYVPKTLNSQEKRALEEMRESDNFKGDNATKRTIFQKFKNYFN